jgi:hypothetical protein
MMFTWHLAIILSGYGLPEWMAPMLFLCAGGMLA